MNLTLALYLVELVHNINCAIDFILVISFFIVAGLCFTWCGTSEDHCNQKLHDFAGNTLKSIYKKSLVFIILFGTSFLLPSKTTMYLMLGTSYLQSSNIPSQVNEILTLKLKDVLDELKDKAKK